MDKLTEHRIRHSMKGTILVNLDGTANYNCVSLKDFILALNRGESNIITPLTTAIDTFLCCQGYRVIVESEGKRRCLNDMLLGDVEENERELRLAHNAERLFLGGAYNIETKWEDL